MPIVTDHGTFFGKRVKRMARYEPGGLDVVFVEKLEQPPHTNSSREEACVDEVFSGSFGVGLFVG